LDKVEVKIRIVTFNMMTFVYFCLHLRPTIFFCFLHSRPEGVCVNLIRVSPLLGLGVRAFMVGQAALKAASNKVVKHEKMCSHNQHIFIHFAFDFLASTWGCWPFT